MRLFALLIFLILSGDAKENNQSDGLSDTKPTKKSAVPELVSCGPNSVYVLLKLHGINQPITNCGLAEIDVDGLSLENLRELCNNNGLQTSVLQCNFSELCNRCQLPLIAHMDGSVALHNIGHYVVVLTANDDHVTVIDGSSGRLEKYDSIVFKKFWTGYTVMPTRDNSLSLVAVIALCLSFAFIFLLLCSTSLCKNKHVFRNSNKFVIVVALFALFAVQTRAIDSVPVEDSQIWRYTNRDGMNCLYIQLKLSGYQGEYSDLLKLAYPQKDVLSLDQISQYSVKAGYPLVPLRLTMNELNNIKQSSILLIEKEGINRGKYCIFLGFTKTSAVVIDGEFLTRHRQIPLDQFRREWTGFALIPENAISNSISYKKAGLGCILGIAIGYLAIVIYCKI